MRRLLLRTPFRSALLAGLVTLAVVGAGCDGDQAEPPISFVDTGTPGQDAVAADTVDVVGPADVPADAPPPPDVPEDAGPACFVSPYVDLPFASGAYSSYTRGVAYPSIRQWTDRARSQGYRGVLFAERHRRDEDAPLYEQFSDVHPAERAFQHVYDFDPTFDYFPFEGDGAYAGPIRGSEDLEVLHDLAIRVIGVEGGWAAASSTPDTPFSYDLQDLALQLRVKAPQRAADARVLVSYTFAVRANVRRLTYVLAGDPGDDRPAPPEFQIGASMRSVRLPLKEQILEELGPPTWTEGELRQVELRVEGDAEVIFDEVRLLVDAYWEDYRAETEKYNFANGLLLVPGVEHFFPPLGERLGQVACVSPDAFPASDKTPADGLFADLAAAGCLSIADRPWAPGAGMADEYIRQADAVEVWHPGYTTLEGAIALEQWDALLLAAGPRTALASSFARDTRDLTKRAPHNHVLVPYPADEEGVVAALAAGRSYLTDDLAARAQLWAERPDCARAELGEQVTDALALHAQVTCPTSVRTARLVRFTVPEGERTNVPLEDAAAGAVVPVDGWPDCYVRLEAECEPAGDDPGARLYTNPIWLTDALP